MARRVRRPIPDLELRVMVDGRLVIGPIQAALLEAVRATGSISGAHREIGASYAHVWKLVAAMNKAFAPPLVEPIHGGARGGGAVLTKHGQKVLDSFRRLENLSKARGHEELLVIGEAANHTVTEQE